MDFVGSVKRNFITEFTILAITTCKSVNFLMNLETKAVKLIEKTCRTNQSLEMYKVVVYSMNDNYHVFSKIHKTF